MTEHVRVENNNGILTITLARPDKKNALTDAMYGKLADTIEAAESDPSVRVLLIRGEGDMFTAGNDVGEFAAVASGKSEAAAMSDASSSRWRVARAPSSPPCRAAPSASAPRCCCIAISSCLPRILNCRRPLSASRWCRKPPPAC